MKLYRMMLVFIGGIALCGITQYDLVSLKRSGERITLHGMGDTHLMGDATQITQQITDIWRFMQHESQKKPPLVLFEKPYAAAQKHASAHNLLLSRFEDEIGNKSKMERSNSSVLKNCEVRNVSAAILELFLSPAYDWQEEYIDRAGSKTSFNDLTIQDLRDEFYELRERFMRRIAQHEITSGSIELKLLEGIIHTFELFNTQLQNMLELKGYIYSSGEQFHHIVSDAMTTQLERVELTRLLIDYSSGLVDLHFLINIIESHHTSVFMVAGARHVQRVLDILTESFGGQVLLRVYNVHITYEDFAAHEPVWFDCFACLWYMKKMLRTLSGQPHELREVSRNKQLIQLFDVLTTIMKIELESTQSPTPHCYILINQADN